MINKYFKRQIYILLLFISTLAYSQSIPSSQGTVLCSVCAPNTNWTVVSGTPDVSNRTTAATNATSGGGATWDASPLPLPPNGHTFWISLRDIGTVAGEEVIRTTISGLTVGREYEVLIYSLSATAPAYSPVFIDFFDYQLEGAARVTIPQVVANRNTWVTQRLRFTALAATRTLTFYPGSNGSTTNFESINISVTLNAINSTPIAVADNTSTLQNAPVTINVTTNDSDPNGAVVVSTVDLDPSTTGIQNTLTTAQGTWSVSNLGIVTFTPVPTFVGVATIPYTIQDNYTLDGVNSPSTSNSAIISVTVAGDSDGDGIPNTTDLDNDNDGILDTVECPPTNLVANGSFTTNLAGWTAGTGWVHDDTAGYAYNVNENLNGSALLQSVTNLNTVSGNVVSLNVRIGAQDGSHVAGSTASLQIVLNNVVYATLSNSTVRNNANVTIAYANGASGTFTIFGTVNVAGYTQSAPFTINIPYTGPNTANLEFRMTSQSDDWSVDDVSILGISCDADGDGIPNYLDTDSDGDGCADAIEGTETVRFNQIHSLTLPVGDANYAYRGQIKMIYDGVTTGTPAQVISTSTAANGVPQLVNNAGNNLNTVTNPSNLAGIADNTDIPTPTTADIGQAIGTSQNSATRDVECDRCFRPATSPGTGGLATNHGITALSRASNAATDWPGKIKGAYTALDAKTKGFVINRLTTTQINALAAGNLVVGMMVYDTTVNCLKLYDGTGWNCYSKQTCNNFNQ